MDDISNYYKILGLEADASPEQVKQAYRDLVRVWHPDRYAHDSRLQEKVQEKLKDINNAYEKINQSYSSYRSKAHKKEQKKYKPENKQDEEPPQPQPKTQQPKPMERNTFFKNSWIYLIPFLILLIIYIVNSIKQQPLKTITSNLPLEKLTRESKPTAKSNLPPVDIRTEAKPIPKQPTGKSITVTGKLSKSGVARDDGTVSYIYYISGKSRKFLLSVDFYSDERKSIVKAERLGWNITVSGYIDTIIFGPNIGKDVVTSEGYNVIKVKDIKVEPTGIRTVVNEIEWSETGDSLIVSTDNGRYLFYAWEDEKKARTIAELLSESKKKRIPVIIIVDKDFIEDVRRDVSHIGNVQEQKSPIDKPVTKGIIARDADKIEKTGVAKENFTVGSTKDEVLAAQGTPTGISYDKNTWNYHLSSVTFEKDRVTSYHNISNNLKIKLISKSSGLAYFTVGSTKDEVLAAQGTPTGISYDKNTWNYHLSSVTFEKDRVTSYHNISNNLKIKLISKSSGLAYFTVGSTKDEVLAAQGTPTGISYDKNTWNYHLSSVTFEKDRVTSYHNISNNLKIKLIR